MNLLYETDRLILEELNKDLDKEIEKYISGICDNKEEKHIDIQVYEKPSFSKRAEKYIKPFIELSSFHNIWTYYDSLCHYIRTTSITQNMKKYQSYHVPSKNEIVISNNLKNKYYKWRTQNGSNNRL